MQLLSLCNSEVDFRSRLVSSFPYRFALCPLQRLALFPIVVSAAANWPCPKPLQKQIRRRLFLRALKHELSEARLSLLKVINHLAMIGHAGGDSLCSDVIKPLETKSIVVTRAPVMRNMFV